MKIDNIQLHEFFLQKNITHLHHANTVATAISFIENGGLLSRGDIERKNAFQTKQASDQEDKLYGVWDDVFFDTADLHGFFPRQNIYGPVLFKFNINFLLCEEFDIWVTKKNPMYWTDKHSNSDRYFQDISDILRNWGDYERQQKMITIRKPYKAVLFDYLEEIIIDDPRVEIYDEINVYDAAITAMNEVIFKNNISNYILKTRQCDYCYCHSNYLKQLSLETIINLFLTP
ncbi:TPA: hypothetical protein PXQ84_004538, partial [Yersinia enterocolitica]|nr:hypothetical protein [Yersinia enterocolitica]